MDTRRLIAHKKLGISLSGGDILGLINGYSAGGVTDAQMAAFLMAVYFTGLSEDEAVNLTLAMAEGERLLTPAPRTVTVDLRSTGGVGDKAWLIAVPIVASITDKIVVPKLLSAYETNDLSKLLSIPRFKARLSPEEFIAALEKCGCAAAVQMPSLAPIEKRIAALCEDSQTTDSIPLLGAGLLARELAAGVDAVVFDVKVGSGSLTKTIGEARKLCHMLTETALLVGIRSAAVMTNMDKPLGRTIGGALEVMEAIEILKGSRGDPVRSDLFEVSIELGGAMLAISGAGLGTFAECREMAANAIASGAALKKLREMIETQGGNPDITEDYGLFPAAKKSREIFAQVSGFIGDVDCEGCGKAADILGGSGGDTAAGIVLDKLVGDRTEAGERLATLYTSGDDSALAAAEDCFLSAYSIVQKPQKRLSPILR